MGKKKNKAAASAPAVAETDDEILEKAKAEVLTVLDQHMVFNIFSVRDGKSDPCPSVSGDLVWYFAEADAAAAMEERKNTHPYPLAMGCTPLGRAFAMTEGWIQTQGKMPPLRLQGSLADLKEFAEQAKDLVTSLLCYKPEARLTAGDALGHPWLSQTSGSHAAREQVL